MNNLLAKVLPGKAQMEMNPLSENGGKEILTQWQTSAALSSAAYVATKNLDIHQRQFLSNVLKEQAGFFLLLAGKCERKETT
ncbi:unnamed protein product [Rangifer tarandus platyrhynchus]|uniref:Uncharacterized protein n=2 Tax=Rangifer tarandus platyrhynchus TaxID=3082113 RepID=A0ABN8Y5N8_RANTA|nr:unnamed protein product [Rangifer tarandus platyrhynchus]CAI9695004.1 unnamed protein product [Rangifer tarandus platyrhynchus]